MEIDKLIEKLNTLSNEKLNTLKDLKQKKLIDLCDKHATFLASSGQDTEFNESIKKQINYNFCCVFEIDKILSERNKNSIKNNSKELNENLESQEPAKQ